jgi:hypothetical protein
MAQLKSLGGALLDNAERSLLARLGGLISLSSSEHVGSIPTSATRLEN